MSTTAAKMADHVMVNLVVTLALVPASAMAQFAKEIRTWKCYENCFKDVKVNNKLIV